MRNLRLPFYIVVISILPSVAPAQNTSPQQFGKAPHLNTVQPEWTTTPNPSSPTWVGLSEKDDHLPVNSGPALDSSTAPIVVTTIHRKPFGALPTSASDLVVVGTVTDYQSHISSSHQTIYTDLTVTLDKTTLPVSSTTLNSVTVTQHGGAVKLLDGRVIKQSAVYGETPLSIGKPYLLFLKHSSLTGAYTVIRAWDLSGSKPTELDTGANAFVDAAHSYESAHALLQAIEGGL